MMRILLAVVLSLGLAACSSSQQSGSSGSGAGASNVNATSSAPQPTGPAPGTQAELNQTIGDRVFFDTDRHNIDGGATGTVAAWAQWLKNNPGVTVLVEGHCDERGTREYNLALGARRSFSVKQALVSYGIDDDRIDTTTFGKERPDMLGSDPASWAKNRRAVMVVTSSGSSS